MSGEESTRRVGEDHPSGGLSYARRNATIRRMTTAKIDAPPASWNHAVVIGGSTTGLLAAAALARHFASVTLVERDRFPSGAEARKGVPQMRHVHVLLKRGEGIFERFLPGLLRELVEDGANRIDMAADTKWYHFGGWKRRFASGMEFYCQSRPLLEWKIRSRVAALPNVRFLDDTVATGFSTTADRSAVTGVRTLAADGSESNVGADLVVDASGRGSRTPQWLRAIGYPQVADEMVVADVGYSTAFFRPSADSSRDWKALFVYPRVPGKRLSVVVPVEGGRWMVTHVGWFHDYPPADPPGFIEFARSLPQPDVYDAIRGAELVSPIAVHRFPGNLRRRYDRLPRFPEGLAVLGDALCSFNPIYGQGMTTGALGVETLDACLERHRRTGSARLGGFADRFRREAAKAIGGVWLQTTSEDLRYAETRGPRPPWVRVLNWYSARVYELAWRDENVSRAFLQVMHLMRPATSLFRPAILARVLAAAVTARPARLDRPLPGEVATR